MSSKARALFTRTPVPAAFDAVARTTPREHARGGGRGLLCALAAVGVALATACGGPARMSGFPEREARAPMMMEAADRCAAWPGRLVIETEAVTIREFPHHGAARSHLEQPLLVAVLSRPDDDARRGEVFVRAAPAVYRPGERIGHLEGVGLLDRPLGAVRGHHLVVRLAENDRAVTPGWARAGKTVAGAGAGGAASLVGLPSPSGVVGQAVELLAKLDEDDLILLADIDLDRVSAAIALGGGAHPSPAPAAPSFRDAASPGRAIHPRRRRSAGGRAHAAGAPRARARLSVTRKENDVPTGR